MNFNDKEELIEENEYGTRRVQQYLLDILIEFDNFCKERNIKYSISGGTLLGAVRHKGFIPWDDDVDVMFDRENYDKLIANLKYLPKSLTIVQSIWVKRLTRADNSMIDDEIGCIDLFVFDNVPDNKVIAKLKIILILVLQGMIKEKRYYKNYNFVGVVLSFLTWLLGLLFTKRFKLKAYEAVSKMGNKKDSKCVTVYNTMFKQVRKLQFPKKMIDEYVYLPFENHKFMSIKDYDVYLRILYGDYMELPPLSQRKPKLIKNIK
jgi:lipopolysaccharide cholinephosphotransferase